MARGRNQQNRAVPHYFHRWTGILSARSVGSVAVVDPPTSKAITVHFFQQSPDSLSHHGQRNHQLQQHESDRALKRVVFPVLMISVVMLWAVMATAVLKAL
jgi:hypothetical protein